MCNIWQTLAYLPVHRWLQPPAGAACDDHESCVPCGSWSYGLMFIIGLMHQPTCCLHVAG